MKKNYNAPVVKVYKINVSNLLAGSVENLHATPIGKGSQDNPVNFGRGGYFDEDEE